MVAPDQKQHLQQFLAWAQAQAGIRAVAQVGSGARTDHPSDAWSDVDLVVVAADARVYLSSTDWLGVVGRPWFSICERTPAGEPVEVRALFEGGCDIDFIFVPLEVARQGFSTLPMVAEIMQRGAHALLDKDGLLSAITLPPPPGATARPPACQDFLEVVNDFWFHTAWTAKKLRRGETWIAKSCCDHYLKSLLLRMLEWEARAELGWERNTWYNGRFLEEWALPASREELRRVFAHYDTEEIWQALDATSRMFRRMAREVAARLSYPYPAAAEEQVSAWVSQVHAGSVKEPGKVEPAG